MERSGWTGRSWQGPAPQCNESSRRIKMDPAWQHLKRSGAGFGRPEGLRMAPLSHRRCFGTGRVGRISRIPRSMSAFFIRHGGNDSSSSASRAGGARFPKGRGISRGDQAGEVFRGGTGRVRFRRGRAGRTKKQIGRRSTDRGGGPSADLQVCPRSSSGGLRPVPRADPSTKLAIAGAAGTGARQTQDCKHSAGQVKDQPGGYGDCPNRGDRAPVRSPSGER